MDSYDVIIIGTGAGGGTLARHLAPSGKRILLLERGDWLPREPANWDAADVFVDNRYISEDTWYDEKGKPFQPQIHYFVGGATKLYGAALYRLRKEDFGVLKHHDGVSPAWPIEYEELEPYYTQAEQLYEVHGARGEDPTEPPASAPYPYPAVSHEPRIQQLSDDLEKAGYHPFHAPCGIRLNESNMPYSHCVRCATCDGFPCLVHAKSDAEVLGVRPALEHPNVTLLTNARATKLETDDSGNSVTEVVVERDGETESYTADLVVLACGAANTAKLLLASANDKHPAGLANGSDQVGRNYMFHDSIAVLALSREENPTIVPEDARAERLLLRHRRLRVPDGEHPDGREVVGADVPRREAAARRSWRPSGRSTASPAMRSTSGSRPRICRSRRTGSRSTPRRQRHADLLGDERRPRRSGSTTSSSRCCRSCDMNPGHLIHRFAYMKNDIPVAGVAHQAGTCRFGTDPAMSVLDRDCKAHELDNLYVVDTSIFPSIGAVNPALTAMANSLRVGDHLLERMGAGQQAAAATHGGAAA